MPNPTGVRCEALWTWPELRNRVYTGFPVNIRVVVLNWDNKLVPAYDVIVNVNDVQLKETVKLLGGERKLVLFDYTPTKSGIYQVLSGGRTASFEAVTIPEPYHTLTITSKSTALTIAVSRIPTPDEEWGFTVQPGKTLSVLVPDGLGYVGRGQCLSIVPAPYENLKYWVINGKDWPNQYTRWMPWVRPQSMVWVSMNKDQNIVCEGK